MRRARRTVQGEPLSTLYMSLEDFGKIPDPALGWTEKPNLKRCFVTRVKCVKFNDGTSRKFYLQTPRPETLRELRQLENSVQQLVKEVRQTLTSAIVRTERHLIKQPYRPRKKAKR